jgi:hypothetical protein
MAARQLWLAWAGALVTSFFAVVFLFSVGAILVPVAAALIVLLGILTWKLTWGGGPRRVERENDQSTAVVKGESGRHRHAAERHRSSGATVERGGHGLEWRGREDRLDR